MMQAPRLTDARILIVDDERVNVVLLERILEQDGYTNIRSTTNSNQAAALYDEFEPDLVLLDLHMPGLDGFAVMEQLEGRIPSDAFLPILILTADIRPEVKRRALAVGAKDFVTKPFDRTEVLLRIQNLLETRFLHLRVHHEAVREGQGT
jgi:putative two-component system response regulator